ncbi:MAG: tRNA (adenosine(37)-N6)-dimethylallyltransferase MiaA [Acidimicrobiales bacterium]
MALVGPTACGKSALAVAVAKELGDIEIVNADSMQVYRGMDIGTAKLAVLERAGVPHHLIDVVEPCEEWDVARFVREARYALQSIESRGHRALLVGGTGLYVHALVDHLSVPAREPRLARRLDAEPTSELYARLLSVDPAAAARISPGNRRRVLRALEVTLGSDRPFSSYGPGVAAFPATNWQLAGIWLPRDEVRRRIEARFLAMLEAGLLAEVKKLVAHPGGLSRTARQALGYKELLAHVEHGLALDEACRLSLARTRRFARRQRMWWRRDPRIRWFGAANDPIAVLPALLREWGQA